MITTHIRIFAFAVFSIMLPLSAIERGVKDTPEGTIINVVIWNLPDPTRPETHIQAQAASVNEFRDQFPKIFAERYRDKYKANPKKYGTHNWDNVQIVLHKFSGITIEGQGMDSGPLMAIAGGVSPDIIYVNFRQSDTYIQQGFLYPLDKPEDGYLSALTPEERDFWVYDKIWPVIRRRGPDKKTQVWAMPKGGILGKVMLYRKDLLAEAKVPFPHNDWTWDDLFDGCKKITNPEKNIFGIQFGRGSSESWYWVTFLWSAGGEVMVDTTGEDAWRAVFNTKAGVLALDFYTRLTTEQWRDKDGRRRYGYAFKEPEGYRLWNEGKIGFYQSYIDEKVFSSIDPELIGMVPVPRGPGGHRGAELNSQMQGIFSGVKNPVIRDAAWEFLRFTGSKEAAAIETRILVDGGMGQFVNPRYLRAFGYEDILRLAPREWEETFAISMETGKPEPYGRNTQLVYNFMTGPIQEAESLALAGNLPEDTQKRHAVLQKMLDNAVNVANEKMIGIVDPDIMFKKRIVAVIALIIIAAAFALLFRRIIKAFTPPEATGAERKNKWQFKKYAWGYILIFPAIAAVFLWQYFPLFAGSTMAFQDYQLMGNSRFIGVDNFVSMLWDAGWWATVYNALRYSILVICLTFLPPVILAVLLQEIPRGTIFFRTVFYLPAVITGLVVIYLWRSFYDPTDYGMLNRVALSIPVLGYILLGLFMLYLLWMFAKRLFDHHIYHFSVICLVLGIALFLFALRFASVIYTDPDHAALSLVRRLFVTAATPYRWLQDPQTAMFACVLPMVWAGMGPGCLIYLAALKGISDDFYEAADIDGASFIDKILFVVIPTLKPLLIIQFVGVFITSWKNSAYILAMTGGAAKTETAGLHIFYRAYTYLRFGQATAMAWMLGFMLIGFTVNQLRILSRLEYKTTGGK